jgi:hypothetical protein
MNEGDHVNATFASYAAPSSCATSPLKELNIVLTGGVSVSDSFLLHLLGQVIGRFARPVSPTPVIGHFVSALPAE